MAWLSIEAVKHVAFSAGNEGIEESNVVVLGDLRISCSICCSDEGLAGETEACSDTRSRIEPFRAAPAVLLRSAWRSPRMQPH